MELFKPMRVQDGHAHAVPRYCETGVKDYLNLTRNIIETKFNNYQSLNVHLPFEVQHPSVYTNLDRGIQFIRYGEGVKNLLDIALYWENSPKVNFGTWDLRLDQTDWTYVPRDIDLCLDTGHLILGARCEEEAQWRIRKILEERGDQIKHLHLHENDMIHDNHDPIGQIVTTDLFHELITNRSYIFEKGIPDSEAIKN